VRIHLTDKGRALRAKVRQIPRDLACRAGFDPDDPRSMGRLVRLREELNDLATRCGTTR
jgi:DNA-binding MarR family transcriptional regulator